MDRLLNRIDSKPATKNATIVIQGDHGSRLVFSKGTSSDAIFNPLKIKIADRISKEDYIQFFSTF